MIPPRTLPIPHPSSCPTSLYGFYLSTPRYYSFRRDSTHPDFDLDSAFVPIRSFLEF